MRSHGLGRHIHLVLENDDNAARYFAATLHGEPALTTRSGTTIPSRAARAADGRGRRLLRATMPAGPALARCWPKVSATRASLALQREPRGEPSAICRRSFVAFLQNHDQSATAPSASGSGFLALADEGKLKLLSAILLLALLSPPLILFMGEEMAVHLGRSSSSATSTASSAPPWRKGAAAISRS